MATAGATGGIIGPVIGGVVSHYTSNREAFVFSAEVVLVAALIATFFVHETKFDKTAKRSHIRDDLRTAWANKTFVTLLSLVALSTFSVMLLEPLITVYVLQLGADKGNASLQSGLIFSAVGIATLIAAPQWGKIGGGVCNLLQFFVGHYADVNNKNTDSLVGVFENRADLWRCIVSLLLTPMEKRFPAVSSPLCARRIRRAIVWLKPVTSFSGFLKLSAR